MSFSTHTTYPSKSAGRLMTKQVPVISQKININDLETLLLKEASKFDSISYIYVVDEHEILQGIISIREVFRSNKKTLVKDILPKKPIVVRPHTHQERVAHLALKHRIKAIPVVDQQGKFLGAIMGDTIMQIFHDEAGEDILRFGGVVPHAHRYDDVNQLPIFVSLKHRLPWLFVGLLGGMAAASVVGLFEEIISQYIILAAFIPLIMYMSDAVGSQMQAFIIRDLAINQQLRFTRYFIRQLSIVTLGGILLSISLYAISLFIYQSPSISFILSLALFLAILSSLLTGLTVPYLFSKARLDPANASGPIGTIIQDVVSVLIYFLVASLLLV